MAAPILIILALAIAGCVQQQNQTSYKVNDNITITWLGHSSFRVDAWETAYFDPFVLDSSPKKADFILITPAHFAHCSAENIKKIQTSNTRIISTTECISKLSGKINSISPTEFFNYTFNDTYVGAYDAYSANNLYHKKGEGVGLLLNLNGTKIYHAGDTENIPELANLTQEKIDVMLVPIGGTYTMNVTEAVNAVKIVKPRAAIPMHYNSDKYGINDVKADAEQFRELLKGSGTEAAILQSAP